MLTIHKIWQIDLEVTASSIVVCEDLVVDELPSESIRDDDDYALDLFPSFWLCNIAITVEHFLFTTFWSAGVDVTAKALGARHLCVQN